MNAVEALREKILNDRETLDHWLDTVDEQVEKNIDADEDGTYLDSNGVLRGIQAELRESARESAREMLGWVLDLDEGEDQEEAEKALNMTITDFDRAVARTLITLIDNLDFSDLAEELYDAASDRAYDRKPCCNHFSCPCGGQALYGR